MGVKMRVFFALLAVTISAPTLLSDRVQQIMYSSNTYPIVRSMKSLVTDGYYDAYWDYIEKKSSSQVTVAELSEFYADLIKTIMNTDGEEGPFTEDLIDDVEYWAEEFEDDDAMDKRKF